MGRLDLLFVRQVWSSKQHPKRKLGHVSCDHYQKGYDHRPIIPPPSQAPHLWCPGLPVAGRSSARGPAGSWRNPPANALPRRSHGRGHQPSAVGTWNG
jgi:hypothetical protein